MVKTKKVKAAGRFGAGYGTRVRIKLVAIESEQRKKQVCPFCHKRAAKRASKAVWECKKCGKRFASNLYYLTKQ